MKTVYFVRHGEAEANLSSAEAYGGHDSPLTEKGREQARQIAARAARLPIDLLVSSTMLRTRDTAAYIADATGVPAELSELFVECAIPSAVAGKSKSDPEVRELMAAWTRSYSQGTSRVEDGENFDDMRARGQQALAMLAVRQEQHVLVVTHGFFLRILAGLAIFGDDFSPVHLKALRWGLRTANTGITVMLHDPHDAKKPGWHMLAWNDHAHLG